MILCWTLVEYLFSDMFWLIKSNVENGNLDCLACNLGYSGRVVVSQRLLQPLVAFTGPPGQPSGESGSPLWFKNLHKEGLC